MDYKGLPINLSNEADKEIFIGDGGDFTEEVTIKETVKRTITISSPVQMTHDQAVDIIERLYDKAEIVITPDDYLESIDIE